VPCGLSQGRNSVISRGRERQPVDTDDADLLAHRVTGSHERKTAAEPQARRDDLTKLDFIHPERLKGKVLAHGHEPTLNQYRSRQPSPSSRRRSCAFRRYPREEVRQHIEQHRQ
jgi:hypothetical protein